MSFLEKVFYIKNSYGKKYKIINLCGLRLKFKLKKKIEPVIFPENAQEKTEIITNPETVEFKNKVATIFVGFNKDCVINEKSFEYIKALKKQSDFLILVYDNPIVLDEIEKIKTIADGIIFKRHNEYDFGSYKRGFLMLKELGILDKVDHCLFCNDTISLSKDDDLSCVFSKLKNYDASGLTINSQGFDIKNDFDLKYFHFPHIQSFFILLSSKIFLSDWFLSFIKNIKHIDLKEEIIINYELGLSKLIKAKGYKLNSYYPYTENVDPYRKYLDGRDIFIKKGIKLH